MCSLGKANLLSSGFNAPDFVNCNQAAFSQALTRSTSAVFAGLRSAPNSSNLIKRWE